MSGARSRSREVTTLARLGAKAQIEAYIAEELTAEREDPTDREVRWLDPVPLTPSTQHEIPVDHAPTHEIAPSRPGDPHARTTVRYGPPTLLLSTGASVRLVDDEEEDLFDDEVRTDQTTQRFPGQAGRQA